MKKAIPFALLYSAWFLLVSSPSVAKADVADSQILIEARILAGPNFLSGGDLTLATKDAGRWWQDMGSFFNVKTEGRFAPAHFGMNVGGEIVFRLRPDLGVALGLGYLQASNSSTVVLDFSSASYDYKWKMKASAIPVTASLIYTLSSSANMNVYVLGGMGYYLARLSCDHEWYYFDASRSRIEADGGGLGLHGGLGLEIGLSTRTCFLFEVRGRLASFRNFEGMIETPYSRSEGRLWSYHLSSVNYGGSYQWMWVSEEMASSLDARQTRVDFSGISAQAGIKYRF